MTGFRVYYGGLGFRVYYGFRFTTASMESPSLQQSAGFVVSCFVELEGKSLVKDMPRLPRTTLHPRKAFGSEGKLASCGFQTNT